MPSPSISAVFITFNEAHIIGQSILAIKDSVAEIIVMDMRSTDGTNAIATGLGATVYSIDKVWNFGIARTYGIHKAKNEWILLLDADEIVSRSLMRGIQKHIIDDDADCLYLPRANCAFSGFAPHESGFPEHIARCFKKNHMDIAGYNGELHLPYSPIPSARIFRIPGTFPDCALYHITNPTVEFFIDKINRYTTIETQERLKQGVLFSPVRALLIPLRTFWVHYILRKGFLDGWRGFWLSISFLLYEYQLHAKLWEASLYNHKQPTLEDARKKMMSQCGINN